jgi:hypothetical protein
MIIPIAQPMPAVALLLPLIAAWLPHAAVASSSSSFSSPSHPTSSSSPTLFPPTNASWTRVPTNPVLVASEPWENTCVCENVALWSNGKWMMWYRGGWATTAVGLATSTDGVSWTKYANNPVYGRPGKDDGGQPWVTVAGSTYYLYVTYGFGTSYDNVTVATSSDGISWTVQTDSAVPRPPGGSYWGNRVVWANDTTTGSWVMLQELMVGGGLGWGGGEGGAL